MDKTNKKTKQLIVKNDVSQFIAQAIEQKLPVEQMTKLFELYKDVKIEQAKEAFIKALADFQKEVPIIEKTKKVFNKDGKTIRYMYAPIDSVIKQIKSPLAENGFSYTWDSAREDHHIKVVCALTHIAGHIQHSSFDVPIVESQFMSSPQSYATAQSYAERYTLLNVLGIATADEDTDSADTDNNKEALSQKAQIMNKLQALGHDAESKEQVEEAVKKITELSLTPKNYEKIISRLQITINEGQGL